MFLVLEFMCRDLVILRAMFYVVSSFLLVLKIAILMPSLKHSHWKCIRPENENMVNLKSATFILITLLYEGLTRVHSQKKPRLHFGESFTLTSYLTNRTFQVTSNGSLIHPWFLETDVPQSYVSGQPLFSVCTKSLGFAITSHGFSYHCYADDTQLFLSFPPFSNTHKATRISECLADSSFSTTAHHLKLLSLVKLNSSSFRERLTWTCQSLSRNLGVIKAVDGTAPVYHTPHASAWALCSTTSAGDWYCHCWEQTKPTVMTLLCSGISVVELTSNQCQDSKITPHLLEKTQDSFFQTSPQPHITWLSIFVSQLFDVFSATSDLFV